MVEVRAKDGVLCIAEDSDLGRAQGLCVLMARDRDNRRGKDNDRT